MNSEWKYERIKENMEPLVSNENLNMEIVKNTTSSQEFIYIVDSVRLSIEKGIYPELITAGSSGSYFAFNPEKKKVGVFKPKDEEPYGSLNPKWTKWLHRNLFPCCFGRSCLIPNLGYISEAAASLIDRRLGIGIVPRTEIVRMSSPSFSYSRRDREKSLSNNIPIALPLKIGSFQLFLNNYINATLFLQLHPWPSNLSMDWLEKSKLVHLNSSGLPEALSANYYDDFWTIDLMAQFRFEIEKLVIFDYLIRNTEQEPITSVQTSSSLTIQVDSSTKDNRPCISIAAIDHGLAFPFKHPDNWRSYPYAWLSLPPSLINIPFSPLTRTYFLSLLTSPSWWQETSAEFRRICHLDDDFNQDMFSSQLSLLKGQGWNLIESLKTPKDGPLELCARQKALVLEEEIPEPFEYETNTSPILESLSPFLLGEQHVHVEEIIDPVTSPYHLAWPEPFHAKNISFKVNRVRRRRVIRKLKRLKIKPWFTSC